MKLFRLGVQVISMKRLKSGDHTMARGARWFTHRHGPFQLVSWLLHLSGVGHFHPIGMPRYPLVCECDNAKVFVGYVCGYLMGPIKKGWWNCQHVGSTTRWVLPWVPSKGTSIPMGEKDEYSLRTTMPLSNLMGFC